MASGTRSSFAPQVPTFKEQGFADLAHDEWFGFFLPAKAPKELVARLHAELESALAVLSSFDEGCDLVLFYKHLMVLNGDTEYTLHFNETDALSDAQRNYAEAQYTLFRNWYANWSKTIA